MKKERKVERRNRQVDALLRAMRPHYRKWESWVDPIKSRQAVMREISRIDRPALLGEVLPRWSGPVLVGAAAILVVANGFVYSGLFQQLEVVVLDAMFWPGDIASDLLFLNP
jgi:hypothetical protein